MTNVPPSSSMGVGDSPSRVMARNAEVRGVSSSQADVRRDGTRRVLTRMSTCASALGTIAR